MRPLTKLGTAGGVAEATHCDVLFCAVLRYLFFFHPKKVTNFINPLGAEWILSSSQLLKVRSYFLKRSIELFLVFRRRDSICNVNRYDMWKWFLFFLLRSTNQVQRLIWKLRGFWCPSMFLDFSFFSSNSGTFFCLHILSCPLILCRWVVYSPPWISLSQMKYLLKRLLSQSVPGCFSFQSKTWKTAYNGLESSEKRRRQLYFTCFCTILAFEFLSTHRFMTKQ